MEKLVMTAAMSKETENMAAGSLTETVKTGVDWGMEVVAAGWEMAETAVN